MAISRKDALKTLTGLAPRVELHLKKLSEDPTHQSASHWAGEVRGWLKQMEEAASHVGKKTGAAWRQRIQEFQARLES